MVVSNRKFQAVLEERRDRFEKSLVRLLRERFPEVCAPLAGEQLLASIRRFEGEAASYRIDDEKSVAKFVLVLWVIETDPAVAPTPAWMDGVLRDFERPAIDRVNIVFDSIVGNIEAREGGRP